MAWEFFGWIFFIFRVECTSYVVMGVSSFQNCDSAYFVMTCIEFRQGCLQVPYDIRRPFFAMHDAISQNTCVGESAFILGLQTFYMRLDISLESLVNPSLFTLPRPLLWAQFPPVQNDYCIEKADILKDMCAFIHSSSVWPIVGGRQNCYSFLPPIFSLFCSFILPWIKTHSYQLCDICADGYQIVFH
jgi:hypothetical protein